MSKVTLSEVGWTEFVREALEEALDRARKTHADMVLLAMCDHAGCGYTFDLRDKRHTTAIDRGLTYHFCPACSIGPPDEINTPKRLPEDFRAV